MKSDLRRERVKLGHEITRPAGLRGSSGAYARTRGGRRLQVEMRKIIKTAEY